MSSKRIVYGLTDPDSTIRYVGFSKTGMTRPRGHASPSNLKPNTPKTRWIRSLLDRGERYGIVVLQEVATDADGYAAEMHWIAQLRNAGVSLTNSTDGGDGARNPIPEAREKIRRANIGKQRPPRSAEWCARLSAANTGHVPSQEAIEKRRAKVTGRPLSEEHKQALREAKDRQRSEGRLKISDEQRAKISAAAKLQWERQSRPIVDLTTGITYKTQREAAKAIGVTAAFVGHVLHGRAPAAAGHRLAFADDLIN